MPYGLRNQSAETQGRPVVIALGGVVEDDIENDLETGPVQRLDHVAKLVHRAERVLARAVGLMGREEWHRRIAPVVEAGERTALVLGDAGAGMASEAAHVHLVDNGA